jgi:flagellar hook-length control protein FliK
MVPQQAKETSMPRVNSGEGKLDLPQGLLSNETPSHQSGHHDLAQVSVFSSLADFLEGEDSNGQRESDVGQKLGDGPRFSLHLPGGESSSISGMESTAMSRLTQMPHEAETTQSAAKPLSHGALMTQIIEKAVIQVHKGVHEIRIKLEPEHLGSLSLEISIRDHLIRASVETENALVKEILDTHQERLREALADHGLKIDQFSVEVSQHSRDPRQDPSRPAFRDGPDSDRKAIAFTVEASGQAGMQASAGESKSGIDILI